MACLWNLPDTRTLTYIVFAFIGSRLAQVTLGQDGLGGELVPRAERICTNRTRHSLAHGGAGAIRRAGATTTVCQTTSRMGAQDWPGHGGRWTRESDGSDGQRVQASVFVPGQPSRAELGRCCPRRAAHCLPSLRRARRGRLSGPPAQHLEGSVAAERPFPHGGSVGEKTVGPLEVGAVIDVLHVAVRQAALPPPPHHRRRWLPCQPQWDQGAVASRVGDEGSHAQPAWRPGSRPQG